MFGRHKQSVPSSPREVPVLLGLLLLGKEPLRQKIAVWAPVGAGLRAWRRLLTDFLLESTVLKSWSGEGSFISLTEELPEKAGWQTAPRTL